MSAKSTPASIDASVLKTSLSPLAAMLDAFNHRHKNAHHSSHWWSHFNILRRSVKKILSAPSRQDALLPRLRWMRDHIVPRAYVPLTQLVADPQHAPLGLLLVGVLGRINTILTEVLPNETTTTSTPIPEPQSSETKADKGIAISRDAYTEPSASDTPDTRTVKGLAVSHSDRTKPYGPKSSKRADTDEFAQIFADGGYGPATSGKPKEKKSQSILDSETAAPPKKKRKKTKTKVDDGFSSIFDSL